MKPVLLTLALLILLSSVRAQTPTQPYTAYCLMSSNGVVSFGKLAQVLPKSVQDTLLVNPLGAFKKFWNKDLNLLLLTMSLKGWTLSGTVSDASGPNPVTTTVTYVFSKTVYLDEASRAAILQRVEAMYSK